MRPRAHPPGGPPAWPRNSSISPSFSASGPRVRQTSRGAGSSQRWEEGLRANRGSTPGARSSGPDGGWLCCSMWNIVRKLGRSRKMSFYRMLWISRFSEEMAGAGTAGPECPQGRMAPRAPPGLPDGCSQRVTTFPAGPQQGSSCTVSLGPIEGTELGSEAKERVSF